MANRLVNPRPQFLDSMALPYSGGSLTFYETATSTPAAVYTDRALTTPASNPQTLDSAGRTTQEIFTDPSITYKVVLKDDDGNTIWTIDPYFDFDVAATIQVYSGDPNGNISGNAGSVGGGGASVVYDITNQILYICTTTGDAASAVWTQVGGALPGQVQFTGVITPPSLGSSQNDYSPTGFSAASTIRQNSSGQISLTGLGGGAAGRIVQYKNISSFIHTLSNENASSAASNRFAFGHDLVIYPGQSALLFYDTTAARWQSMGAKFNSPIVDPGGRLTLTTAIPVLTSDVTAAATVYYTPYKHGFVTLYSGSDWYTVPFSEASQALSDSTKSPAAATTNSLYDMFVWNDAGTIRCTRGPAWSSATARGTGAGTTELERVNGAWVNKIAITNGPAAQRGLYVGTISTDGSTQLNMTFFPNAAAGGSNNRIDVWNMFNRVEFPITMRDSTDTWNYTTATIRAMNNNNNNRITLVAGQNEDAIDAWAFALCTSSATPFVRSGIALDLTNAIHSMGGMNEASGSQTSLAAFFNRRIGLGRHFLQQVEYSEATGTTAWYGDNGEPTLTQCGMVATWKA